MKTIPNKTADDIIKWLSDLKSHLPDDSIQAREKARKIDKAIKILSSRKNSFNGIRKTQTKETTLIRQ